MRVCGCPEAGFSYHDETGTDAPTGETTIMSILSVYHESAPEHPIKVLTHFEDIAATLADAGVRLEREQAGASLAADASPDEVIAAYRPQIDRLMSERGFANAEVLSVARDHSQKVELRAKFLDEHRQAEDQVRFFVAGRALFCLHIENMIHAVLCEKGDLISVPAGTRRWFDIGEEPHLRVIRLFNDADGGVTEYTGDDIASRFPRLDDLL